jgi:hypothetical protein
MKDLSAKTFVRSDIIFVLMELLFPLLMKLQLHPIPLQLTLNL